MYLRHLRVQNVKLLRDVQIDFVGEDGKPRMWTVFVGENRSCKTTLLQTIAAAASGRDQAIHLTTDVISSWPDLRRPGAAPSIDAEFDLRATAYPWEPSGEPRLKTHLHLEPGRSVLDGNASFIGDETDRDPLIIARQKGFSRWFVAGYGVRRMLHDAGTADRRRTTNPSLDRLKPLFGEDVIGTGFIELLDSDRGVAFVKILRSIFVAGACCRT